MAGVEERGDDIEEEQGEGEDLDEQNEEAMDATK